MVPEKRDGRERVDRYYRPLVREGVTLVDDFTDEQLAKVRDFLVAARELTERRTSRIDRHRTGPTWSPTSAAPRTITRDPHQDSCGEGSGTTLSGMPFL